MKAKLLALFVALFLAVPVFGREDKVDLITRAKQATVILMAQGQTGGLDVRCTATAFEKNGSTYKFVSAAHCVGEDDKTHEKSAPFVHQAFYVTFDEKDQKVLYAAKPVAVGYQSRGDDFSVFEVKLPKERVTYTIPLGDEKKEQEGNPVINPASPQGLGVQLFRGNISKMELERPLVESDINWMGVMLLQMPGTNGGSSGSAIISEKQEGIVGFLVGTIGETTVTAVPVSRFKSFLDRVRDGKYRWMVREED